MKLINQGFDIKDIVYAPVFVNTGQPMFFEKNKVLTLKCFTIIDQSEDYIEKLADDDLIAGPDVLNTENFDLQTILDFCSNIAYSQKKHVVLEFWEKKKDVDVGPFVLYDSKDLPN